MPILTLNDKLRAAGNAVDMMYHAPTGRYAFPVASEFSHWSEEQRAWHESVALLDQSFHMTDLYVSGPDTINLVSSLAVNSFAGFGRDKAKQLVCCNEDGYVIGDAIIFGLEDDAVNIVGRPILANWVQYNAEIGGWNVKVTRDDRSLDSNAAARLTYRFEIQGPRALELLNVVNEGGPLTTKFFNMGEITIAGCKARTLSHGMGGAKGLEIWGPAADSAVIRAALMAAGEAYGLRCVGSRAYAAAAAESGWVPSPLPAIYTGEAMRAYRDWLPANGFEATSTIGGSFLSHNVEDYYFTPWDLDYGGVVRFDHQFIGRAALEAMASGPHRRKVTLVWDKDDVAGVFKGMMDSDGLAPKIMEMPAAHYAAYPYDRVEVGGRQVGVSITPAYLPNARVWISLAILDPDVAETGSEVSVIWGEPDGGSRKLAVERHRQVPIRATVQPWPFHKASREANR